MFEKAGTNDYRRILSTKRGIRAAARFIMSTGLLLQFSLANEIDEVAENLAEKIRRRLGRKSIKRNRPKRTLKQKGIFYNVKDAIADAYQRALNETAA